MKLSSRELFRRRFTQRLKGPAVPNHHCAAAVLTLGNCSLKIDIRKRMVLDLNCQMFLSLGKRKAFRHRRRLQRAVQLQSEIIVQSAGIMLLNDEAMARAFYGTV